MMGRATGKDKCIMEIIEYILNNCKKCGKRPRIIEAESKYSGKVRCETCDIETMSDLSAIALALLWNANNKGLSLVKNGK